MTQDNFDETGTVIKQTWTGLLAQIRTRPGVYLGSTNLQALHMLVDGFSLAEVIYAIPDQHRQEVNDFPWNDFETYVSTLKHNPRSSLSSFDLAQYEAHGKTVGTFDAFKEYPGAWEIWWRWHDDYTQTIRDAQPR